MPRAAAATDVFNAIAEPRRRRIIDCLQSGGPHAVGDLVEMLGLPQPVVSKHLGVLRQVGLVSVEKDRQRRLYRLNGKELKAVHDWIKTFDRFWTVQLDRIKARAELAGAEQAAKAGRPDNERKH